MGDYAPRMFETNYVNGVNIPPLEVIKDGTLFWKDQLVGFLLGNALSYSLVKNVVKRVWKLKCSITMRYGNVLFFFQFTCPKDRQHILEVGPLIIQGKPFIIITWSPLVEPIKAHVLSIPICVPSVL